METSRSYSVTYGHRGAPVTDGNTRPELADVGRLTRRFVRQVVGAARADESSLAHTITSRLGPESASFPVASGSWPPYDQVNVQAGLDAWLAEPGREHTIVGITGARHSDFGLADLTQLGHWHQGLGAGSVTMDSLPAAPGGLTRACIHCAVLLITDEEGPAAVLVRAPDMHGPVEQVMVEVSCADDARGRRALDAIRRLAVEHNVFRGHVVAFGEEVFGHRGGALLSFVERPHVSREQVILPDDVLTGVESQVLGVARHADRLRASGQHLKRGVLLHGAPGTGKTHMVRYLIGQLAQATVVLVSGSALRLVAEACSVARALQPSVVVVEDVDLIAEERGMRAGPHPLLFQLLNEMDGLGEDLDVTFLLTTNRADLLEPALAQRPGRVDHAAMLPLPDAEARHRLIQLYQGNLELDLADTDAVLSRTEGVTASFIKELLRRAALRAAGEDGPDSGALRVTDEHMGTALDQLLDTRSQLTRSLLGSAGQGQASPG
ncbi:MAG TPA: ATP-binding protein [Streptosporangiaceae bacterium]|nr:ATP-binding protein [Streptosporangiaceae bacterium]